MKTFVSFLSLTAASQLPFNLQTPSNHTQCDVPCAFNSRGVATNWDTFFSTTCNDCMLEYKVCYLCDYCDTTCAFNDKGVTTDPVKFNSAECKSCMSEESKLEHEESDEYYNRMYTRCHSKDFHVKEQAKGRCYNDCECDG